MQRSRYKLFELEPLLSMRVKNRYPKRNPNKLTHVLKPSVWWFSFEPYRDLHGPSERGSTTLLDYSACTLCLVGCEMAGGVCQAALRASFTWPSFSTGVFQLKRKTPPHTQTSFLTSKSCTKV